MKSLMSWRGARLVQVAKVSIFHKASSKAFVVLDSLLQVKNVGSSCVRNVKGEPEKEVKTLPHHHTSGQLLHEVGKRYKNCNPPIPLWGFTTKYYDVGWSWSSVSAANVPNVDLWISQRQCWMGFCRPKWELFESGPWDKLAWAPVCGASRVIGSRLGMSQELCWWELSVCGEEGLTCCGRESKDRCSDSARRRNMTPSPRWGDRDRFVCSASKTDLSSSSTSFALLIGMILSLYLLERLLFSSLS